MDIGEARTQNKGKVIIWYPFNHGGQIGDRGMWCAEKNGNVLDYNKQGHLISDALAKSEDVVVLTLHRDGSVTVTEIEK